MKRIIATLALSLALTAVAGAQTFTYTTTARQEIAANKPLCANNYHAYPDAQLPELTPAPEGYEPFFIDHYGRHGSRWLHMSRMYDVPLAALEKAAKLGQLTKRGKRLLDTYRIMAMESRGRECELSDVGAEQHQRIGRRMTRNFPQVFRGAAQVDAKSTVVGRCILSMQNEVDQIKAFNPGINLTIDASEHDMYFMNNWRDKAINPLRDSVAHLHRDFFAAHINPDKFLKRIFSAKYARDSIKDKKQLMLWIFDGVGNMQSHHAFDDRDEWDLFTAEECYRLWQYNNVYWYLIDGSAPANHNRIVYFNSNLLLDFIEKADDAIITGRNGAALRFGHESVLLPLVCLMGINGADYQTTDLETLDNHWRSYDIFPMACNVQLVLYRPTGGARGDILVKALLNEREATLPIATDRFPYYRWDDLRTYYINKLCNRPIVNPDFEK